MPDNINDPNAQKGLPKAADKARLPETPEEAKARKLKELLLETDDMRAKRRAKEFAQHFDVHMANVKTAHARHPAPVTFKKRPWESLTDQERKNWNNRSVVIKGANRAYYLAAKRTFMNHQNEDAHLARVRKSKKEVA